MGLETWQGSDNALELKDQSLSDFREEDFFLN